MQLSNNLPRLHSINIATESKLPDKLVIFSTDMSFRTYIMDPPPLLTELVEFDLLSLKLLSCLKQVYPLISISESNNVESKWVSVIQPVKDKPYFFYHTNCDTKIAE